MQIRERINSLLRSSDQHFDKICLFLPGFLLCRNSSRISPPIWGLGRFCGWPIFFKVAVSCLKFVVSLFFKCTYIRIVVETRVTLPREKALIIGEFSTNCYTYGCSNTFYYYMFFTLANISHKLEKWEANELSHHSHQLLWWCMM